jgi:replication fork clamp-binding protein CrfC
MRTIHRVPLVAAFLLLFALAASSVRADVSTDAKKAERELVGLEQQYKQIVLQLQAKTQGLPPALSSGLAAVVGKAQQCLATIAKAKSYAKKIQAGGAPSNASSLLQQHMQQVRQKQAACNDELTRFSQVAQDYLSARQ